MFEAIGYCEGCKRTVVITVPSDAPYPLPKIECWTNTHVLWWSPSWPCNTDSDTDVRRMREAML